MTNKTLRNSIGRASLAALALVLLACKPPQVVVRRVEVPVPVPCPEPPYLAWPDLPIYHLPADARPQDVVRAFAASVERLQGQLWQAYRLLDGYRTKTPAAAPRLQPGGSPR